MTATEIRTRVARLRTAERECQQLYWDTGQPHYIAYAGVLRRRWKQLAVQLPALEWVDGAHACTG